MDSPQPPLFTTSAHVFQIDPETKKSWLPISNRSVSVSFYYDSGKSVYKIISVDGSKAVINSTFVHGMTFTKISQKFGQWTDSKLNTVFGLGFTSDKELRIFADRFKEIKENLRLGQASNPSQNSVQIVSSPSTPRDCSIASNGSSVKSMSSNSTGSNEDGHQSPGSHRSSSSSSESQMKYENDRLKKALAQSSANAKKWESEFQTLKNNNARLTAALQESAVNVEKWKEQLNNYKEENSRLRKKVASSSTPSPVGSNQSYQDLNNNDGKDLEQKFREVESRLRRKEEELNNMSQHSSKELLLLREKNSDLLKKIQMLEAEKIQFFNNSVEKSKHHKNEMKLNQIDELRSEMDAKLRELTSLQQQMDTHFK